MADSALHIVSDTARDIVDASSEAVLLSLSSAWLAAGAIKPATTSSKGWGDFSPTAPTMLKNLFGSNTSIDPIESPIKQLARFDTSKLYCVQLGDYFMPLSQTFTLRAKKRLNVSSLVDGPDIIQQTRKEAKTIDCSLRLTLRNNQPNLEIVRASDEFSARFNAPSFSSQNAQQSLLSSEQRSGYADTSSAIQALSVFAEFLNNLYEHDEVFRVVNDTINDVFGVEWAFISEYKFIPQVGKGTFNFEFSLTEVKYGDNVLTFDARQIGDNENIK